MKKFVLVLPLALLLSGCGEDKESPLKNGIVFESSHGYFYNSFCFRGKLYLERGHAAVYTGEPCPEKNEVTP